MIKIRGHPEMTSRVHPNFRSTRIFGFKAPISLKNHSLFNVNKVTSRKDGPLRLSSVPDILTVTCFTTNGSFVIVCVKG